MFQGGQNAIMLNKRIVSIVEGDVKMNRTIKLLLGIFVLTALSCNALTRSLPVSNPPTSNPVSPFVPTTSSNVETPELAEPTALPSIVPTYPPSSPQPNSDLSVVLIPFNYTLQDLGDGWNQGQVSIAIENTTDTPIVIREIKLGEVVIETKEGVTYTGELSSSDYGNNLDTIDLYQDSIIPPHFRFAVNSTVADGLSWYITWKSAIAATPTKITFSEQPQLDINIPSEQGSSISFPFDSAHSPRMDSISSLNQISLGIFNDNIKASFTGKCWDFLDLNPNPRWNYTNVFFLEFVTNNTDQFNQQTTLVNNPMSFFYEDGRFVQQILETPIFWDVDKGDIPSSWETEIALGPGQAKTGYMLATGYPATYSSYLPPIFVIWDPDGSYTVFDATNDC